MAVTITLDHDQENNDVIVDLECPAEDRGNPAASLAAIICERLCALQRPAESAAQ